MRLSFVAADSKRSRSLLHRSKTMSQLLSAGSTSGVASTTGDGTGADSSAGSLSVLADPFSPPAPSSPGSVQSSSVFRFEKKTRGSKPSSTAGSSSHFHRSLSEGHALARGLGTPQVIPRRSNASSTADTEAVLSDEDIIVVQSPCNSHAEEGNTSPVTLAPPSAGRGTGSLSSPCIEGIDKLLTSPLVSTPVSRSFF